MTVYSVFTLNLHIHPKRLLERVIITIVVPIPVSMDRTQ